MNATCTKIKSAQPMGQYQPTALDARKAAADILLTACGGGSYSVSSKVALSGRGIKAHAPGNYSVTEAALGKLRSLYTIECDF